MFTFGLMGRINRGLNIPPVWADLAHYTADNPTFYNYVDLKQCMPRKLVMRHADELIEVDSDSDKCIIVAKPSVLLTNGLSSDFLYWEFVDMNEQIQTWPYESLPIVECMLARLFMAVYGLPYIKSTKFDAEVKKIKKLILGTKPS